MYGRRFDQDFATKFLFCVSSGACVSCCRVPLDMLAPSAGTLGEGLRFLLQENRGFAFLGTNGPACIPAQLALIHGNHSPILATASTLALFGALVWWWLRPYEAVADTEGTVLISAE